jgi:hypothetical protein
MVMFWPIQLTHQIASWAGYDITPPTNSKRANVGLHIDLERGDDDSDDSDENLFSFTNKENKAKNYQRPKSPKDAPLLLNEDAYDPGDL